VQLRYAIAPSTNVRFAFTRGIARPNYPDLAPNQSGTICNTCANNPDLSGFKKAGGKLLIWHGLADQLIFPQGTVNYFSRVQKLVGGKEDTTAFARLFLAPGVAHCAGGSGPQPDNPLNQLVNWVEHSNAPTSLNGVIRDPSTGAITETRPICLYPDVAVYKGHGPTTQSSSFVCRPTRAEKQPSEGD